MKPTSSSSRFLSQFTAAAVGAFALFLASAQAGTHSLIVTNTLLGPSPVTLTVVEADGFNSGGTAGNTVQTPSPADPFSTNSVPSAGDGLWHWRDFASMNLFGVPDPGGVDLLETAPARLAPELRTSISGLAADTYEVYLVYTTLNTTGSGENPQLLADIETATVTTAATVRQRNSSTVATGRTAGSVWDISLQPLGQVTGTSFNVLVATSPTSTRGDYIGIAYVPAAAARIFAGPTAQTTFTSSNVTFTAGAFGNPAPAFQWLKNGGVISGANTDTLSLNNVTLSDAALYSVRVTNATGSNVSSTAQLNIIEPLSSSNSIIALGTNAPFNFVQADAFMFGGAAANSVQVTNPATDFAVLNASVAGYWNYRDFAPLNFYGGQFNVLDGDPDLLETSAGGGYVGPTLRTTIPGLTAGIYEVSLVHVSSTSGSPLTGLLADLDPTGTGTTPTTLRQRNGATLRTGVTASTWEVDLQPLGQVTATSINVLVGDAGGGVNRGAYLGLAYRLAAPSAASILTQPANQVAFAGTNTTFSVSAGGNPLPRYQWRKNGVNISNATNSTYNIPSPSAADAGFYSVLVTNNLGGVVSSNALLNVFAPTGPTTIDITLSTNATFHFIAADAFTNGGTAGNTVVITNAAAYFATSAGTLNFWHNRDFASLDMFGVGTPSAPDLLETVPTRFPADLRTTISGLPAGNYDVYLVHLRSTDGVTVTGLLGDIEGGSLAVATTLRVSDANTVRTAKIVTTWEVMLSPLGQINGTGFNVLVSSAQGVARGDYIGVAYRQASATTPLAIVSQPATVLAYAGSSNRFAVNAIGSPPLTYQWRKNGTNVVGAVAAELILTNIASADAGGYSVVVTDANTNATSVSVNLNVFTPLGGGLMDINVADSPATFRFVPADVFVTNTATAGNTINLTNPTAPFAVVNTATVPGFWNYRDFASMDLYGAGTSTNLDLMETGSGNAAGLPTLKTTISGLALANYEVFLVHNWRPNLGEQPGFRADLELNGLTDATTVRRQTVNFAGTLRTAKTASSGVFEVVLQPLGQVHGTNFSVLLRNIDNLSRGDYYGLAYRAVDAPVLGISQSGGVTVITWSGSGNLQSADEATGPYVDVAPAAASPYTVPTALAKKFYRLKR